LLLCSKLTNWRMITRKNKWNWTPLMIAEGHRPGNFRPSPETIAALERIMPAAGVTRPPKSEG
jgi:hypothetical protein